MVPSVDCPFRRGVSVDRSELVMYFTPSSATASASTEKYVVLFASESNIGKQGVLEYVTRFQDHGATAGMLVVCQTGTLKRPITTMAVSVLQSQDFPIEVFEDNQLVFNVLLHELQPHFEVVDPAMHADIARTFCEPSKLPRMRRDDAVARLLGVRRGDIVKMTNIVETAGASVTYLVVV